MGCLQNRNRVTYMYLQNLLIGHRLCSGDRRLGIRIGIVFGEQDQGLRIWDRDQGFGLELGIGIWIGDWDSTTLSISSLDNLRWWIDEVQKVILSGGEFTFLQNIQIKNTFVIEYKNAKRSYTNGLMMSVDDQRIAKPMEASIIVSTL